MNLTLAIIIFYRRGTSFSDIVFLAALIITYHSESIFGASIAFTACKERNLRPQRMRFLPILFLSTSVPMVLSPLMMSLWTQTASGNANFPFFQGLILWVSFAVAIIEFANQTVQEIDCN